MPTAARMASTNCCSAAGGTRTASTGGTFIESGPPSPLVALSPRHVSLYRCARPKSTGSWSPLLSVLRGARSPAEHQPPATVDAHPLAILQAPGAVDGGHHGRDPIL